MGLLCLLLRLVRAHCFTSSVVTPWGYKSERFPLRISTSSHTISRCLLASFLVLEEREGKGRFLRLRERCFSFPLEPWWNKTRPLPRSCRCT
jgi:hypothetical protein